MPRLSFSDIIGIAGIVFGVVLIVLDKAGKLKGQWLFILLAVAACMTLSIAIGNGWVMDASERWRLWRGALMFCVVMFTYSGIALWISPVEQEVGSVVIPAPKLSNSPLLQAGGRMLPGLPISIPPRETAHILRLRPDLRADMIDFINDKDFSWQWPRKGKIEPVEWLSQYDISNHDTVRVFNLRTDFPITFYFPNNEGRGVAAKIKQRVVVPSLDPGSTYSFYVVNQSKYDVFMEFPQEADLQVQGSTERIKVKVVAHGMLADEDIPPGNPNAAYIGEIPPMIPSSTHEWDGDRLLTRLRK